MPQIDSNFDQTTQIVGLTVNNVGTIPFEKMLEILTPFVLVQIPEDTESVDEKRRLDFLLARCANLHSFLLTLWSQITYLRAKAKAGGSSEADDLQKKKETLYELASAMKLKYEAASRKITVLLEDEPSDRANYDARRAARDDRSDRSPEPEAGMTYWPGTRPQPAPTTSVTLKDGSKKSNTWSAVG